MEPRKTPKARSRPPAAPAAVVAESVVDAWEEHEALPNGSIRLDPEFRDELIRRAAYAIAEQRGFVPGRELDDWLAAEATIDAEFAGRSSEP